MGRPTYYWSFDKCAAKNRMMRHTLHMKIFLFYIVVTIYRTLGYSQTGHINYVQSMHYNSVYVDGFIVRIYLT